jgi:transcriptional regulator with XRE-family HTH domain
MPPHRLPNYLKTHRKYSGLDQRDIAFLLGNSDGAHISRYEKHHRIPPLETALAFEAIFKVPVAELFAGLHEAAKCGVEGRARQLALSLRDLSPPDGIALRKSRWLAEHHGVIDLQTETISCPH